MVLASSLGLLSSREFVRDLAWFAEQLVMTDMTPQFFDDADKLCAACRERPAFFAPDKVGADASEAAVAATRAAWAAHLRERYTPRVVEFIDTGVGQQKQACVAVLRPTAAAGLPVAKPLVLVLWRGSKAATDYLRTDTTQSQRVRVLDSAETRWVWKAAAEPSATCGLLRAYAGGDGDGDGGDADARAPRGRVAARVEELLAELGGDAHLVIAGHSLGGSLATLCAYDLLERSAAARAAGATLVTFGEPRFFTAGFRAAFAAHERAGRVAALRVLVDGDFIPRYPPRWLGASHGVGRRLVLHPDPNAERAVTYYADADDGGWGDPGTRVLFSPTAHTSHALLLGGLDARAGGERARRREPCPAEWPAELEAGRKPEQFI